MRFQTILYIVYVAIACLSYPYLRNAYFPQNATKFEKFIMWILASVWIVSVPTTLLLKQQEGDEMPDIPMSMDGFMGKEQ